MALRQESCEHCAQLEDTVANLELAIQSRDLIGQAKGILMATSSLTADAAFALLVSASQRSNRKVRCIAEEVVANAMARASGEAPPTRAFAAERVGTQPSQQN